MSNPSPKYEIGKKKMVLLTLLAGALLIMNVALVIQNRALKAAVVRGEARSIVVKPGKMLPPLAGIDTDGNKLTFEYGKDSRKTLLLVFSPRCPYCTDNMPNWRAMTRNLNPGSFRAVGVSLLPEGAKEYVAKHGITEVPLIADPDPKSRVAYEMNLTPQTILIDAGGRVENVWTGLLSAEDRAEIEQALGLTLSASR